MDATTLCRFTIAQLAELLRSREVSPVEATEAALGRAEQLNDDYNAFIAIWREDALSAARDAEREIASGNYRGLLRCGKVPLAGLF